MCGRHILTTASVAADSDKSLSSQSTLVPPSSLLASEDHPLDIMGLINAQSRPTLTKSRVLAHDKFRQQGQGYQSYRSSGRKERKAEEDREGGGKDDDQRTIEGIVTMCSSPLVYRASNVVYT